MFQGRESIAELAWSPDGRLLASAAFNGPVRVWDASTGQSIQVLLPDEKAGALAWHPDSSQLALVTSDGVKVWPVGSGQQVRTLSGGDTFEWTLDADWSPDGSLIALGRAAGGISILDGATGRVVLDLEGHQDQVQQVKWSPDGAFLLSQSVDGTLRIWDVKEAKATAATVQTPEAASPANNGAGEAVEGELAGQIVFLSSRDYSNLPAGMPYTLRPHDVYVMKVDGSGPRRITSGLKLTNMSSPVVSPDGTRIAVGERGTRAAVNIYAADGTLKSRTSLNQKDVQAGDWSQDGLLLTVFNAQSDPDQVLMDVTSGESAVLTPDTEDNGYGALSPDGKTVAFQYGIDRAWSASSFG